MGLPKGMVNRIEDSGSPVVAYDQWATLTASKLSENPIIGILINNNFDSDNNVLKSKIKVTFLDTYTNELKLVVSISEDSIIAAQLNYEPTSHTEENYVHMHMMRGDVNTTCGEVINVQGNKDDVFEKEFTITLDAEWSAKNCNIVAYVYDNTTTYKEILQAEFKKFISQ